MNIVLDLRATYGHFAVTPFIQPRLASVKGEACTHFPGSKTHGGHAAGPPRPRHGPSTTTTTTNNNNNNNDNDNNDHDDNNGNNDDNDNNDNNSTSHTNHINNTQLTIHIISLSLYIYI